MAMPETVKIVEVGPRDGLQNESGVISPEVKVTLIERLGRHGPVGGRGGRLRFPEMGAPDGGQ